MSKLAADARYIGRARPCYLCGASGVQESFNGDRSYECERCHGTGIAWGVVELLEWEVLNRPLGIPVKIVRELPVSATQLAQESLFRGAIERLATSLQHAILTFTPEGTVPQLDIVGLRFSHPKDTTQGPFLCEDFGFPFAIIIERCCQDYTVAGYTTACFLSASVETTGLSETN